MTQSQATRGARPPFGRIEFHSAGPKARAAATGLTHGATSAQAGASKAVRAKKDALPKAMTAVVDSVKATAAKTATLTENAIAAIPSDLEPT